MEEQACKRL